MDGVALFRLGIMCPFWNFLIQESWWTADCKSSPDPDQTPDLCHLCTSSSCPAFETSLFYKVNRWNPQWKRMGYRNEIQWPWFFLLLKTWEVSMVYFFPKKYIVNTCYTVLFSLLFLPKRFFSMGLLMFGVKTRSCYFLSLWYFWKQEVKSYCSDAGYILDLSRAFKYI